MEINQEKNQGLFDEVNEEEENSYNGKETLITEYYPQKFVLKFLFYSYDEKFIIKTINNKEKETMKEILLEYYYYYYYYYVKEHEPKLITKIYGVYTLLIKNSS